MKPSPPDVESALNAARDFILKLGLSGPAALSKAADDWEVKPDVLRLRFQRAFGKTPEEMEQTKPVRKARISPQVAAPISRPPGNERVPANSVANGNEAGRGAQPVRVNRKSTSTAQVGGGVRREPVPSDFGFGPGFDATELERECTRVNGLILIWTSVATLIVVAAAWRLVGVILAGLTLLFGSQIIKVLVSATFNNFPDFAAVLEAGRRAARYKAAREDWVLTSTEIGEVYWRSLKGVPFEHAVAKMFLRRGCEASLTKGSGDGGVDIFLTVGPCQYGCQCKGHVNPIGVKTIREIVGSCQRHRVMPVVFATNGFTKPALEEAQDLGVICFDAKDLCRLAHRQRIKALD